MFVDGCGHITACKNNDSCFLLVYESLQKAAQIWTHTYEEKLIISFNALYETIKILN